jgi:soluble lytic murein transglycosylase-like protein
VLDLSTVELRKSFVKGYAEKYGIDLSLLCAVIEHESSWNPWSIRFEPAFESRYIKPALPAAPSTLELTKAMSFGLMQIMGETAIELGFQGKFLSQLCDPGYGVDFGCRKFRRCLDQAGNSETLALLRYNGGSDNTYPVTVIKLKANYVEAT